MLVPLRTLRGFQVDLLIPERKDFDIRPVIVVGASMVLVNPLRSDFVKRLVIVVGKSELVPRSVSVNPLQLSVALYAVGAFFSSPPHEDSLLLGITITLIFVGLHPPQGLHAFLPSFAVGGTDTLSDISVEIEGVSSDGVIKLLSSSASGTPMDFSDPFADFDLADLDFSDLGVDFADLADFVADFAGDFDDSFPDFADFELAAAYDGGTPQLFSPPQLLVLFGVDLADGGFEDFTDFTIDLKLLLFSDFPLDLQDFSTSFTVSVLQLLPDFSVLCTDLVFVDLYSSGAASVAPSSSSLTEDGGQELALFAVVYDATVSASSSSASTFSGSASSA